MPGLTALICVPLMWHWVGGGFSAVHGTVACLLYVMYMDGWLVRAPPLVRAFSFLYKLAGPLLYAKLALLGRGWCELLLFLLVDWWAYSFIRSTSSEGEKTGGLHLLLICSHLLPEIFFLLNSTRLLLGAYVKLLLCNSRLGWLWLAAASNDPQALVLPFLQHCALWAALSSLSGHPIVTAGLLDACR